MEITKDDFDYWLHNPVTQEVFQILRERQERIAHGLARGGALVSPDNAEAVGRYKEIDDLLTMQYEDMKPPQED